MGHHSLTQWQGTVPRGASTHFSVTKQRVFTHKFRQKIGVKLGLKTDRPQLELDGCSISHLPRSDPFLISRSSFLASTFRCQKSMRNQGPKT